MKARLILILTLATLSSFSHAGPNKRKPSSTAAFSQLQTKSGTAFECEFDFKSTRTGEQFKGRVRLSSVGEFHLLVQRNEETPNECDMGLVNLDRGLRTQTARTFISGTRIDACVPVLSGEMRTRLNNGVQIMMNSHELTKPAAQRTASISVIYLEGLRTCRVTAMDDKAIADLATRYQLGKYKKKSRSVATEKLDISKEQARLKRGSK